MKTFTVSALTDRSVNFRILFNQKIENFQIKAEKESAEYGPGVLKDSSFNGTFKVPALASFFRLEMSGHCSEKTSTVRGVSTLLVKESVVSFIEFSEKIYNDKFKITLKIDLTGTYGAAFLPLQPGKHGTDDDGDAQTPSPEIRVIDDNGKPEPKINLDNPVFDLSLGCQIGPALDLTPYEVKTFKGNPGKGLAKKSNPIGFVLGEKNKKDPGGEVTLFYGTNRNIQSSGSENDYGSVLSRLSYGSCKVTMPPGHKQGELERPRKILFFQRTENPSKDIVLQSVSELPGTSFYQWLKESVMNSEVKSALVFIHGYNNTFAEVARRTAQIVYDIPFDGIAGFFSWPSSGETLDYTVDMEKAIASRRDFETFIEELIAQTGIEQLHLIGHSMGNVVLTEALNRLSVKQSFKDKIKVITQIVLAAPDIDVEVFQNDVLPEFKSIGNRRTLYASDKDIALMFSRKLRFGRKRIGEAGDDLFVTDGLDTIDASNVMSEGNHHSYMFENKELLYDLYLLLTQGLEPLKRRLSERTRQEFKFWLFHE